MANVLGNYNPEVYANEALTQLFKTLGMASRVHRGVDMTRPANLGDTINLKRPTKFVAKSHARGVGTDAQDVVGENVSIQLDKHEEVRFAVPDIDVAHTTERIINDHIRPAAFALSEKIDRDLHALSSKVGPSYGITKTQADSTYITGPRKVLVENNVRVDIGDVHYLVDAGLDAAFLDSEFFSAARVTGQGENTDALRWGWLGTRFGIDVFQTQNADINLGGITSTGSNAGSTKKLKAAGAQAANSPALSVDGARGSDAYQAGDTFSVTGDPTKYIITGAIAASSGAVTWPIYPALRRNVLDNAEVIIDEIVAPRSGARLVNLMFHRDAFGLAFAPLPMTGDGAGARMATVSDADTGISVRSRMWYDGATATNNVALDVLYGVQVLDPMMAVQVSRPTTVYPSY